MKPLLARAAVALTMLALLSACGHSRVVKREGGRPAATPAPAQAGAAIPRDGRYEVRRGDTLYGIAFRHGLDYREVARWNGIDPPYTIYPGQRLRLRGDIRAGSRGASVTGMPAPRPSTAPVAGTSTRPANPSPANGPAVRAPAPTPANPSAPAASTPANTAAANPPTRATSTPPAPVATGAPGAWRWPANGQLIGRFVAGDPKRQGLDIAGNAGDPVLAAADGVVVYSGAGLVGYGELIIVKHSDEWLSAYAHNRRRLVGEGAQVRGGQQIAELGRSGTSRDMLHFEVRRNGKPIDPLQVLPPR